MSLIQRSCSFESLNSCLSFLGEQFPKSTVEVPAAVGVQPDGSHVIGPRNVPRYLFRGEPKEYADCVPALYRFERDSDLDGDDQAEVKSLTTFAIKWFCDPENNFLLPEHDAEGLVQHLGLPTKYIDFSEDPDVAAAFALGKCPKPGQLAAICVLDVKKATDARCSKISELKMHRWCERARRQAAYGFAPQSFRDLRLPEAVEQAGLWWFHFAIQLADIERFGGRLDQLLDPGSDPVSGLLRFQTNLHVAENGKLRPRVAKWISHKIPMVPVLAHRHDKIEFLRPDQCYRWDEEQERQMSLHYWSTDFEETTLPADYLEEIGRRQGLFLFPCTYHPSE